MKKINIILIASIFVMVFSAMSFGADRKIVSDKVVKSIEDITNMEGMIDNDTNVYKPYMPTPNYDRYPKRKEHEIIWHGYLDGNTRNPRDKNWGVSATYRMTFEK